VRDVLVGYTAIPDEVRDYAADTAAGLLDDMKVCRGSARARCRGASGGWDSGMGNAGGERECRRERLPHPARGGSRAAVRESERATVCTARARVAVPP
jgi:hypothetical protein